MYLLDAAQIFIRHVTQKGLCTVGRRTSSHCICTASAWSRNARPAPIANISSIATAKIYSDSLAAMWGALNG